MPVHYTSQETETCSQGLKPLRSGQKAAVVSEISTFHLCVHSFNQITPSFERQKEYMTGTDDNWFALVFKNSLKEELQEKNLLWQ